MNHNSWSKSVKVAVLACSFLIALIGLMGVWIAVQQPVLAHNLGAPHQPSVITDTIVYSRVVSATSSHEVRFVNLDGTNDISITLGWRPRLSPDDNFISFNRDGTYPNGTGDNIYIKELATETITRVVNNSDFIVSTNWSADSQYVLLDASCAIYRINRDGSNVTSLTQNRNCWDDAPSANPLDGRIAFHNQILGGIWTMHNDGSNIQEVPNTQANDWWASWSKDGQWLSFLRGANYYKIRPDGTGLTQLTFSTAVITGINDYNPDVPWSGAPWSSDDRSIVGPRTVNGTRGIYAIATDGSGATTLVLPAPDGTWVDSVGTVVGSPIVLRYVYLPLSTR